eukprot:CAMPEP_0171071716 /NCGR_PEP_ID=MMETSP0766_2-20121228/10472_1 /TAXON_ID=439317 /ORGANISM="Gambierdiscus australes, Strain CAWD 149" /LENGTH=80 /DNA_ID=CAMNT_0011528267 /DNA_START=58 /DNA_END=297 /DNA_ORIENTATION=-
MRGDFAQGGYGAGGGVHASTAAEQLARVIADCEGCLVVARLSRASDVTEGFAAAKHNAGKRAPASKTAAAAAADARKAAA